MFFYVLVKKFILKSNMLIKNVQIVDSVGEFKKKCMVAHCGTNV